MSRKTFSRCFRGTLILAVLVLLAASIPGISSAQDRPTHRMVRTYIPPDQLVSFLPSTPFNQFVEFLNPIFERVTSKQIVDPESRTDPIGISIAGMHFLDAFELVLEYNGLVFRETDGFFIVEPAVEEEVIIGSTSASAQSPQAAQLKEVLATLGTREIQINAILFELNSTKMRDLGIDWNVFFGSEQSGGQSGSSSGSGNLDDSERPRFYLKTGELFSSFDDVIIAPQQIEFSKLTQFFRLLETNGIGETVANPSVTVQSGEEGKIQIGTDVPIQTRDFAGNTITQLLSTGIIINVTPTLITEAVEDTVGAEEIDFIHLDVLVEKSSSRPSLAGPMIDRNTANTQVLLLDGEQTIIGGLYSTEESITRRGIPILKDLPGWFFGLRYIFGYTQRTIGQKELLIVLQARVLDPLEARAQRPFERNLLEGRRRQNEENIRRVDESWSRRNMVPDGSGQLQE